MANILFVTWDGGGNVPPALGIASELQTRGHSIRFMGHASQQTRLSTAGYDVVPAPSARPFSCLERNSPLALIAMFGDRGLGRDVVAEIQRRSADLVVVDCLLFGVMDALRQVGQPYVVLEHLFDAYLRGSWMRGPMGLGMRLKRLHPMRALADARLRLVATLPALDPSGRRNDGRLTYVGPVVTAAPRIHAEPTVLVSLSTYRYPRMAECLQTILDACAGLDARVVVTTGPVVDPADLRAPANAELHRYVPHGELMPSASLLISHGGHSTAMAALAHDLPMILMPMHKMLDQPMVAASIEATGAGQKVGKRISPDELAPIVARMLGDGPHRAAAARLGEMVRSMPGASKSAIQIEALLRDGAPGRSAQSGSTKTGSPQSGHR